MELGTTYRERDHRVAGTGDLSGHGQEASVTGSCLHGMKGTGCEQGTRHIQLASKLG